MIDEDYYLAILHSLGGHITYDKENNIILHGIPCVYGKGISYLKHNSIINAVEYFEQCQHDMMIDRYYNNYFFKKVTNHVTTTIY